MNTSITRYLRRHRDMRRARRLPLMAQLAKGFQILLIGSFLSGVVIITYLGYTKGTGDAINPPNAAPIVDTQVMMDAARGKTCSPEPTLTDTIVFITTEGKTLILSFDEAYAAAIDGKGKVVTYCK